MLKGMDCTRSGSECSVPFWIEENFDKSGGIRVVISETVVHSTQAITFNQMLARCIGQLATKAVSRWRSLIRSGTVADSSARQLGSSEFLKSTRGGAVNLGGFTQMKSTVNQGGLLAISSLINVEDFSTHTIIEGRPIKSSDLVDNILSLHGVFQDSDQALELTRGCPGMPLLSADRAKLQFTPLHPFQAGEIIAFDRDFLSSNQTKKSDDKGDKITPTKDKQLCYAVVVKNIGSSYKAVRRLRVRLSTGSADNSVVSILSSQVYTFSATRASMDAADDNLLPNRALSRKYKSYKKEASLEKNDQISAARRPLEDSTEAAVGANELVGAVHEILGRVGLSLDTDSQELMSETLILRETASKQETELSRLSKENNDLRDRMLCKICMARDVEKIILPSGKLLCGECVSRINGICPFTRRHVDNIITVHFD